MVTERQHLLGLRRPGWGLLHGDRAVMRGAVGWIGHLAVDYLVSGDPCLGQLAERNLLRAAQIGEVRVALVPATELVRRLAHAGIILPPPRIEFAVVHSVANGPGHGDLTGQGFAACLAPQRARKNVAVFTVASSDSGWPQYWTSGMSETAKSGCCKARQMQNVGLR